MAAILSTSLHASEMMIWEYLHSSRLTSMARSTSSYLESCFNAELSSLIDFVDPFSVSTALQHLITIAVDLMFSASGPSRITLGLIVFAASPSAPSDSGST